MGCMMRKNECTQIGDHWLQGPILWAGTHLELKVRVGQDRSAWKAGEEQEGHAEVQLKDTGGLIVKRGKKGRERLGETNQPDIKSFDNKSRRRSTRPLKKEPCDNSAEKAREKGSEDPSIRSSYRLSSLGEK